jgi:hypothetical protein
MTTGVERRGWDPNPRPSNLVPLLGINIINLFN